MRKMAIKLGRELTPMVKISDNDNFKGKESLPYEELLERRQDSCNRITYSIRTDWCYFMVFIKNTSSKPVELFPVRIDALGNKRKLDSITVKNNEWTVVPLILDQPDAAEHSMQILDANGFMMLDLRFRGVPTRDEFRKAQQYLDPFPDDEYFSAEEGPPTPREPTPVSALAVVPPRSWREELRRKNAFDPLLHHGTRAQFDRMHALLG